MIPLTRRRRNDGGVRWAWRYSASLVSTWPARVAAGLFTVIPLALAVLDSNLRFLWLFLFALFLDAVQAWHAYRLDQSAPQLSLGEPIIGPRQSIVEPLEQRSLGSGQVIRVPVTNKQGAREAQGVYATLRFTGEEDDFDLQQRGRWRDAAESPEIALAGNGRPHEVDLFVHFNAADSDDRVYIWNQESLGGIKRDDLRIEPAFFRVEVTVRGSHPKAVAQRTWRVWARTFPEIIPAGELFPVERTIQEVEQSGGKPA